MNRYLRSFKKDLEYIKNYYSYLVELTDNHQNIGIINEWIIDNYATLLERNNLVMEFFCDKKLKKQLDKSGDTLVNILLNTLETQNYKVNEKTLIRSINNYQKEKERTLGYREIILLKPLFIMVVVNKIKELCKIERAKLDKISQVDYQISLIEKKLSKNKNKAIKLLNLKDDMEVDPIYIERLNYHLTRIGTPLNNVFYKLNEILEVNNLTLRKVTNEAQTNYTKANIYISKLFNLLRIVEDIEIESLYEEISETEKELEKDKVYKQMDNVSKNMYRAKLLKKAELKGITELTYARRLIAKSNKDKKHIGFYLFPPKDKLIEQLIYINAIAVFTFIISFFLSFYLTDSYIISFLILIIPTSEFVVQILNQILLELNGPKSLPRLAYKNGIPEESATVIVVPTIIKDLKKVDAMFMDLEQYYLSNKSNNLYFALLGDCSEQKEAIIKVDKEISEYGIKKCNELNKKYKKDLFYFAYRKRVYHESEESYLGWERKRGALLHFNRLLLGKFTKEDIEKYFNIENISVLKNKIKYVITVDAGNVPVVNSATDLAATMAHPLVKPVLNKEKTKVISGYGILEPKLSVDIESSNKSIYAELFAGLGGFDVYNTLVSNFYQDVFDEGSFMGKGIYDLEVFETILDHRFPEQLILSHDLLESNYLRSGYTSNIEIIDDFSSSFLTDMTRHHRWSRGDIQITPWLFNKVKNENNEFVANPTTPLGKWKIFDNIRRNLIDLSLLLIIFFALVSGKVSIFWWIMYIVIIISLPLLFYLKSKISFQFSKKVKVKPYHNIIKGGEAIIFRSIIQIMTLPYKAWLYLDSMIRALYRLISSKKKLLNWITAEEAEKTIKNNLSNYIKSFRINYVITILLLLLTLLFNKENFIYACIISIFFLLAPYVTYSISKNKKTNKYMLKDSEKEEMKALARKTWNFFEENLTSENHFLIPDNYQENREHKLDIKTSSTDIGFSLTSVVSAYELGFIKREKCLFLLNNIINSVEHLPKWNGHLYNWYKLEDLSLMYPHFVSSVDSGNFVACLIVVKEFLSKIKEEDLRKRIEKLISATDFSKLYTKDDVFSIGYNTIENELSVYNYNRFASESRLLSYIAISKGDVPSKHWFCLDKTLTKFKYHKGVASWSGSLFEYYMPLIFMKSYKNTLLDESYDFAYFCQKYYMEEINKNLPWGISECAYDELDNGINYKYKTFSIPYLKLQEINDNHIVISPYSSMMVITERPKDVYHNYKKLKKLQMEAKYGLYESYDTKTKNPIYAYFAHHQGMILASLANYLEDGIIQELFASDMNNKAFEILTKEKIQLNPVIDLKIAKYKRFNYEKEKIENDIRYFTFPSDLPEVSVVSNSKYTVLMNDRGDGFSRYKEIQLNRYRKVTEQDYGTFLYIKDLKTNKIWSNTYAPINTKPEKYEIVFASDKIKYILTDNDITTTTEIVVTSNTPAEIRKVTLKNNSNINKVLELTSFLEPIITENVNDVTHRTFNSLFMESLYDDENDFLIMKKIVRNKGNSLYLLHRLYVEDKLSKYEYETRRENFIGRNRTSNNPIALERKLSNKTGTPIDPVMSMRNSIELKPNEQKVVYIMNVYGTSIGQVTDIAKVYNSIEKVDEAIVEASIANINNTKKLSITGEDMQLFNTMLNYLYQTSKINISEERRKLLKRNTLAQENLWKFGISGDRPLITITIDTISSIGMVKHVLKAYEYFKSKGIYIDVAIINDEKKQYRENIKNEIEFTKFYIDKMNDFRNRPGVIYLIDKDDITEEERILLNTFARLSLDTSKHSSLKDFIKNLQSINSASRYIKNKVQENLPIEMNNNLEFYNNYGGFTKNGKEYVITNDKTPTPWFNIIANKTFGSLVSNNLSGFTYYNNSQEYKITSWTNDIVSFDQSEGFKINDELFNPSITTHGFGYSKFTSKTKDFEETVTEFIPRNDNVKIYLFEITNNSKTDKDVNLTFFINPVLGEKEEKTSRYILCDYISDDNYLKLKNVYNNNYRDTLVFMSSNEKIAKANINRILVKSITNKFTLKKSETKTIIYTLGVSSSDANIKLLTNKYKNLESTTKELQEVISYYENLLSTIRVNTPDKSLNYILNGWYLYQTIIARITARAGFYQVSGAFGYRDQLQDSTNLASIMPSMTKNQIIKNAMHQFKEGDVLHWWLEPRNFGLRTKFKDDYLWLVYSTSKYLEYTNDLSILDIMVPFVEGALLGENEDERGMIFNYSEQKASIYEHCRLSIHKTLDDLGPHHLPKFGGGDWNDGMNKVGIKGTGESIWLAFFFYDMLTRFIEISKQYNKNIDTTIYEKAKVDLQKNIEKYAYDKSYYLRGYFDNGNKLGSIENDECKIDLISQSFAILSDACPKEKYDIILDSVKKYLVDNDTKIVKLLTPAFDKIKDYPGYIKDYPKGIRENGGQYTHSVAWYIEALIKANKIDEAYNIYQNINPINRTKTERQVKTYKTEPYVIAADIYSNKDHKGRGGWTWYTGSSGWFYKVGIEDILGFNKKGDKLEINPHVPSTWDKYEITYKYMDTVYNITVIRDNINEICLDDKLVDEIHLVNDIKEHNIVFKWRDRK